MNRYIYIIIYFYCVTLFTQELPPIQNFSSSDYNAENQNWDISQSSSKLIYIANNKGLLEFNGANWTLYPSPNETIMRSVKVVDDRIYTGCYMEFGYWQKDTLGVLRYLSLSKVIKIDLLEDEEFWNIIDMDIWIIFQSLNRIYIYNTENKSVNVIESKTKIPKIFKVDERIYFQRSGEGIFKIENGRDVLVSKNSVVKENEIINIFPSSNGLLLLTKDKGFYHLRDDSLKKWQINASNYISGNNIYSAIQLTNDNFAIGTIADGLICLDNQGNFLYQITQSNGLINNTVLSIFEDEKETLWLGLDNGISYVNVNSHFKVFRDKRGVLGSVYASAAFNSNLYLGTNQGLFYKPLKNNSDFILVEGSQGQVWNLKVIDNELFCMHHNGTYLVNNNKIKKISEVNGTWDIKKIDQKDNFLLQGNYDGLSILEKINGQWEFRNKIKGFNNSARYFEVVDEKIFINHEYKGIFNGTFKDDLLEIKNLSIDTILKGANSSLTKYNNKLLYAYKDGILNYHYDQDKFYKDTILSKIYSKEDYISGKLVYHETNNELWAFTNSNLVYMAPGELTATPKLNKLPLSKIERDDVDEYENIISIDDNYLLGTNSGYMLIKKGELLIDDFVIEIDRIVNSSARDNLKPILIDKELEGNFDNSKNNIEISFYTPEYNKYLKPLYQFKLSERHNEHWSEWSENSIATFKNLQFGDYTFNVRAKIGDKISSNIAYYKFSIAKPWYISNLMLAIYFLGILLFSFLMHNIYKTYYKKQKNKLVEKNKRELELSKSQSEKEIMKIKNEQLLNDIQSKSRELAASTMSVVKKNELLSRIKELLLKLNDQKSIDPVIKIIDKSLDHNDNWKLFKDAFDNVDRKFLNKLKNTHPNLTPNDIKLCAYLRLNLSSKEIAPLFNISTRSVEIKRYRLRKKLNLGREENLVKYILDL